jgi:glycosyltransferase involved in cell wall biosynthesis
MRILEINTEKTWRGGERQTLLTLKGVKDAGIGVDLLCLEGYPLAERAKSIKITVHKARSQGGALGFLAKNGKNYDLLHAQTALGQTQAVLTKPFHKKPVIYTRRVDFVPRGTLTKLKYKMTDKVIAVSAAVKEILVGLGVSDIDVISDMVWEKELDVERAMAFRESLDIGNRKIVATTSALVPHKDPLTMVEAVKELLKMRDDFVFLHFGEGVLKESVETRIEEYGIGEVYKLLGHHDGVEDYFSIFDVFVMSSKEEGFGSSVLDAFIYKVPVVSTDAGGLKECVGENGLLCAVKDHGCLAESISRVLSDNDLKADLVERGYEYASSVYSESRIIGQYLDVFRAFA